MLLQSTDALERMQQSRKRRHGSDVDEDAGKRQNPAIGTELEWHSRSVIFQCQQIKLPVARGLPQAPGEFTSDVV